MSDHEFWLSDAQFERIKPHLPTDTRGVPRVDDRRVISGIVHVIKSGGRWVDAPASYGPRKTLYNRFVRLAEAGGPPAQVLIDSSAVVCPVKSGPSFGLGLDGFVRGEWHGEAEVYA